MAIRGEIHQAHEILLQSMFVLVSRNPFFSYSSIQPAILIDLMGKDIPGDSFALERAMILYNICWVTLKNYPQKGNRYASTASMPVDAYFILVICAFTVLSM